MPVWKQIESGAEFYSPVKMQQSVKPVNSGFSKDQKNFDEEYFEFHDSNFDI